MQPFSTTSAPGPKKSISVHVADVHHAWFDGTIHLKDKAGTAIASIPIQPRGRYGGTLVVLIDEDGVSHSAWNEVPNQSIRSEHQPVLLP